MTDERQYIRYVTYDRWEEAHARLMDAAAELTARVKALEEEHVGLRLKDLETEHAERRSRQWQLSLAFFASLVFPLILTAIVVYFSSKGH